MKVKALRQSYYEGRKVKPGDVFELKEVRGLNSNYEPTIFTPEQQFSSRWMEKIEEVSRKSEKSMRPKKEIEEN